MADETKQIEATLGPYAGQRLTMPAADADQAIEDGWARDPFAPPAPAGEEPTEAKLPTDEERETMLKAAERAARKLRGEKEPDEDAGNETRDVAAGAPGEYETRDAPVRRGPGRPPTRR